jgi:hypothetical protein
MVLAVGVAWILMTVINAIGFATPWISGAFQPVDEAALGAAIKAHVGERYGVYTAHGPVFAFVAVRDASYYNFRNYFIREFITQLIAAVLLVWVLTLTRALGWQTQLALVALLAGAAALVIHGQYWNWWGFSARYTLPAAINFVAAWLIPAFVLARWLVR